MPIAAKAAPPVLRRKLDERHFRNAMGFELIDDGMVQATCHGEVMLLIRKFIAEHGADAHKDVGFGMRTVNGADEADVSRLKASCIR